MSKTKIVYQKDCHGERFAALTLAQVAKAMWSEWKKQGKEIGTGPLDRHVLVDFAEDTTDEDAVSIHHGLLLQAPFDSPILITGGYGGYDVASAELAEAADELGYGTDWKDKYPDMTRPEAVLQKALEGLLCDKWKDENGLLWCDVKDCIETYIDSLPEEEKEVINNF